MSSHTLGPSTSKPSLSAISPATSALPVNLHQKLRRFRPTSATGTRRLVRDLEPAVEKKPRFEIDLRVEGVSQDAILQYEEKTTEIHKKLEKLRIGSCTTSVRNDLSKGNVIFSEESSRAVYEMGNMELIELRQTSATIQCPSCPRHVPEGLRHV